jgi:flagellar basal-body rod protein FlgC
MFAFQLDSQPQGVEVSEVLVDSREPIMRYQPGHPDADANGYVGFPRVNPAEDMVDLMSAARNYQANVAAISAVKDMLQKSLDILR